ncbi:Cytochrome P450 [Mycena kentingensis (nom. inval.)]|nr:Cytochrome P450 [Mycena kentingensis (nom. inval.)]
MAFDLAQSHIAAYGAAALLAGYTLVKVFSKPNLSEIPAIGPSGLFTSYLGAYRYIFNAKAMILEGSSKYRVFRVPLVDRWNVIIVGAELVDQLRWAKEDELSSLEGFNDVFQGNITLGPNILGNPYHLSVTRVSMAKNIGTQFDEVHDEIRATFEEQLKIKSDEWVTIPVKTTIQHAICRTTNRLFVGLPLCRNQDYLDTNFEFATSVVIAAQLLNIMPAFMRPFTRRIVGPFVAPLPRYLRRSEAHLTKLVAERVHLEEERGNNYPGRANDLISWLLDVAEGEERTVPFLVQRVLNINLAAIHTSSTAFGNALIDLAVFPDSVDELREEAENIILEHGSSKDSVAKMHKIDSFLRESQRFTGNNITFMVRKVVKDGGFTFADGTTVPKGCFVEVATGPMHFDPAVYPNPHTFDALRFYRMRLAEDDGAEKHEAIATSLEYVVWGHGRHACPGRFIAVTLLKTMIAHVLLNYDLKMEDPNAGRPESQWFASTCSPSPTATVMFRKRKSRAS